MDDLIVSGLRIDWNMLTDSYVSRIPSLRSIDELEFHKNVTFLVGENGSGKSTLLEGIAVACGFNAEGGTRNYRFSTYDDTSDLAKAMMIYRQYAIGPSSFFLRAESFFTLATQLVNTVADMATCPVCTRCRMAKDSWRYSCPTRERVSILWTNPNPRSRHSGN